MLENIYLVLDRDNGSLVVAVEEELGMLQDINLVALVAMVEVEMAIMLILALVMVMMVWQQLVVVVELLVANQEL